MPIYWTARSIPELSDLPKKERARVWQAARWKAMRHWQTWVSTALFIAAMLAVVQVAKLIDGGGWSAVMRFAVVALGVGGAFMIHFQVVSRLARPYAAEMQSDRFERKVDA